MAKVSYTYSVSLDFPNHRVDLSRLYQEIVSSSITIALDNIEAVGDACTTSFKADLSTDEKAVLDGLVAAHSGEPLGPEVQRVIIASAEGTLNVAALPPTGLKRNSISPNWCDRTTWWYSADRIQNEVATTMDPNRLVWNLAYQNVIDVYHGKMTGERSLWDDRRVTATVGGNAVAEKDPHNDVGDYVIDYAQGTLTFDVAVPAGQDPVVSYWRENGSTWIMAPSAGEVWKLKGAESQFSDDVVMTDSMVYEVWAYNPADPPNKIMVAAPDYYQSILDFVNDANKAYPPIPAPGGAGWRGSPHPIQVFSWDFQTTTDLFSSYGMELRVRLEHDTPFDGSFATGTFYFIREPEVT